MLDSGKKGNPSGWTHSIITNVSFIVCYNDYVTHSLEGVWTCTEQILSTYNTACVIFIMDWGFSSSNLNS